MNKIFGFVGLFVILSTNVWSQGGVDTLLVADSIPNVPFEGAAPIVKAVDETTIFRPKKMILPSVLIVVGAVGVATHWLDRVNYGVRDGMAEWRDGRYVSVDDYLQYVPVVSTFGLSLLGAKAKHGYLDRVLITATSYLALAVMVNGMKYSVKEERPDGSARNSFPSGHTATAFMGAELVRMEYGHSSPLYGIGAYAIAVSVGIMRIYNERHWCTDVLAGAGIGILSARIGYWMLPVNRRLFGLDKKRKPRALMVSPTYNAYYGTYGGMVALRF